MMLAKTVACLVVLPLALLLSPRVDARYTFGAFSAHHARHFGLERSFDVSNGRE